MANTVRLKRSSVPGWEPSPGDLLHGELGINYAVGVLFFKDTNDAIQIISGPQGDPGATGPTGPAGADGQDTVFAFLTNEAHVVSTANDGSGASYTGAGGTFKVFDGEADVTTGNGITYSVFSETGVDVSIDASTGVYTVSSMSADTAVATLRAVYGAFTLDREYSIARSKTGSTGPTGPTGPDGATWTASSSIPDNGTGDNGDLHLYTVNGAVYLKSGGTWSSITNITGPTGPTGPAGLDGATWTADMDIPEVGDGDNGDFHLRTTTGVVYQKSGGTWSSVANLTGPTGPTGPAGSVWTSGAGAPDNGNGANGDFYLNTSNGDVYQKSGGTWSVVDNIGGPTGPTGPAGAAGAAFYSWSDVTGTAVPQNEDATGGLIHTFGPVDSPEYDGLNVLIQYSANSSGQVTVAMGDFSYTDLGTLPTTGGTTKWRSFYVSPDSVSATADNFLSIYAPGTVTAEIFSILISPIAGDLKRVPYTSTGGFEVANSAGGSLVNEAASGTNPTLIPRKDDVTSGVGANATGQVSLIAGGTERVRAHSTGANVTGDLAVSAGLSAATKSFLIPHPSKPGFTLRHGSLEGPENGVYLRGKASGKRVHFPDFWVDLIDPETITIQVTPIDGGSLHVKHWDATGFTVGGLFVPKRFFWIAYAERKDVPKLILEDVASGA